MSAAPRWTLVLVEVWFLVSFAAPVAVIAVSMSVVDGMCSFRDPLRTFAPSRGYDVTVSVALLVTRTWVTAELARELGEERAKGGHAPWIRASQFASLVVSIIFAVVIDALLVTWTLVHSTTCSSDDPTVREICSLVDPSSALPRAMCFTNAAVLAGGCVLATVYACRARAAA